GRARGGVAGVRVAPAGVGWGVGRRDPGTPREAPSETSRIAPSRSGERARVPRGRASPHPTRRPRARRVEQGVIHRECGVLKTTYEADMGLYPLPIARWTVAAIAVLFFAVIPLTLHEYFLSVANLVWIAIIGALGLNILVGYTGQVSIGHGAFMSVGAYTAANLANRLGSPWPVNLVAGGLMAALIGAIVVIPCLR